ncbi:MAG: hypothetical protein BWK79_02285 [Beggiatoa sp. IS2]|nr:MAG: hypothetical protein BWK79_02285 [Beggiatoa sp. IS2]
MTDSDIDNQLRLDTQTHIKFACDVLRVLRHLVKRIRMEHRKTWKTEDLLQLIDVLIQEITTGVTEEDKQREAFIAAGKEAFAANIGRAANPHPKESKYHAWWDTGWRDAEREKTKTTAVPPKRPLHLETATASRRYRVQINHKSEILEWNETLHMYVNKGGGTLFTDYDEALALANRLKSDTKGTVSVITVDSSQST